MNINWETAPEWAVDVRDAKGVYGIHLIFTNDDKRYCAVDSTCEFDCDIGEKDYLGVIHRSEILSRRPL